MKMRSAKHTCIGTCGGNVNTKIQDSEVIIDSEGDDVTGIGDASGSGSVSLIDSAVTMSILASNPKDIGTSDGDITIRGGAVNSLVNNRRIPHNSN